MWVLFSPSEAKFKGGDEEILREDLYIFKDLFDKRVEFVSAYNKYVTDANDEELINLFGTKKMDVIEYYKSDIFKRGGKKAVLRYDGVAYDYLDYQSLNKKAQSYIDHNCIIFSNLFGPILARDPLPDYKLKQGMRVGELAPEKFYHKHFKESLDNLLKDEEFIDLRAGFYDKFYKPNSTYTTLKFIKNGKVVSHWAKAYRGLILRAMAINNIINLEEFMDMEIENLHIKEIIKKGIKTQIIYEIL